MIINSVTNYQIPVVRAIIMSLILIGSKLSMNRYDLFTAVNISIFFVIIMNPFNFNSLSFRLSYFGFISIICFSEYIRNKMFKRNGIYIKQNKHIYKIKKEIKTILSISIAAQILIVPIIMYEFNNVNFSFIIVNILVSGLFDLIVVTGILSLILPYKLVILFKFMLKGMIELLLFIIKKCSLIPNSNILVKTPSVATVIIYYVFIILCIYIIKLKHRNIFISKYRFQRKILTFYKKNIKKIVKIILILILVVYFISNFFKLIYFKYNLHIYFIDVGQGDSTLIVGDKTILIDGGGSLNEKYDVGEKILLPYLLDRGVVKIDYIIISHFDADHVNGLIKVLEKLKVINVIIGNQNDESEEYRKILSKVKEFNVNLIIAKSKDTIYLSKTLNINVLYPSQNDFVSKNSKNNNSLVFKLNYFSRSILFTGDIEKEGERKLIDGFENEDIFKSDIIKIAHHGSKTSSTNEILELVNPEISLIGVGKDNFFRHPHFSVLKSIENIGSKIYRTDLCGEIEIIINRKGKMRVKTKL